MKNTKKRALYIVAALLAALFVLSCLIGFAACGGGDNKCADGHTVTGWTETKEATCTESGSRTGVCDVCGESVTETIPALGHDYVDVVTAPTCGEDGYTTSTCSRCGDSYTTPGAPATGKHTWDEGTVTKAATCTEKGETTYTCTECGQTSTTEIPALGHDYQLDTTAEGYVKASCGDGTNVYVCSRCDATYTETVKGDGNHTWGTGTVTKNATKTENGERTFTCTQCGESKVESFTNSYLSNFVTGAYDGSNPDEYYYYKDSVSQNDSYFTGSSVDVEFDGTKFIVNGTAAAMTDGQLAAFWGAGAEDHTGAEYIVVTIFASAGESFKIVTDKNSNGYEIDGDAADETTGEPDIDSTFFSLFLDVTEKKSGKTLFTIVEDDGASYEVVLGTVVSAGEAEAKTDYTENFVTGAYVEGVSVDAYYQYTNKEETNLTASFTDSVVSVTRSEDGSYVVSGTSAVMNDDQLKAFWGSANWQNFEGDEYIVVTIAAAKGETVTVTSAKGNTYVLDGDAADVDDTFFSLIYDVTDYTPGKTLFTIVVDDETSYQVTLGNVERAHQNAENARVDAPKEDDPDFSETIKDESGNDVTVTFTDSDITVSYDSSSRTYTIEGTSAKYSADQLKAMQLDGDEAHTDCWYVSFKVTANAGETITIKTYNGDTPEKTWTLCGEGVEGESTTDGAFILDTTNHTCGEWRMELEVTYANGDKVTYTIVLGTVQTFCEVNGHTLDDGVVTKEPTCTDAGERTYTCEVCGKTTTEEIPALGHTVNAFDDDNMYAKYDENGESWQTLCETCDQWFDIDEDEHSLSEFVLVANSEASLDAAIDVAGARTDGGTTQILVYGTITISDESYVKIDCDNVEIYGLGAENSKIVVSSYNTGDGSGKAQSGVEITGKNVTIRDLAIDGTALNDLDSTIQYSHAVEIRESAANVALINLVVTGGGNGNEDAPVVVMEAAGDIEITDCTLTGGHNGFTVVNDNTPVTVTISGGTVEGERGIFISGGSKFTLNVYNATVNGKNSLTYNSTVTFTDCTFGYVEKDGKAYGSVNTYTDVTFVRCKFLSHSAGTVNEDAIYKDSLNYVIRPREAEITLTFVDCTFVNINTDIEIGTLDLTKDAFLYVVGSNGVADCYLYFGDPETSLQYVFRAADFTVAHNHDLDDLDDGVVTAPTCTEDGYITYTCAACGETKIEIIPATGHSAATYSDGNKYAVYYNSSWYTICEVCGEWFEIEGVYSNCDLSEFVLVADSEASLNAAISVAGANEYASEEDRTQILVYGTIEISCTSYVNITCGNVEIYGLGAENSAIVVSCYYTGSGVVHSGVEITGSNVTIRDLAIDGTALNANSGSNYDYRHAVAIRDGASNVVLSNLIVTGGGAGNNDAAVVISTAAGDVTISDCEISGAYNGVEIEHTGSNSETPITVAISGGTVEGRRGVFISGDTDGNVTLKVEGATVNGKNSLTYNSTVTFTDCTFGYFVDGNTAYGSLGTYTSVTFVNCKFLSHSSSTTNADAIYKNSLNYVVRPRCEGITLTFIGCTFVNTHTEAEIGTIAVSETTFVYLVGSDTVKDCYLWFGDPATALEYVFHAADFTVEHNHAEEDWDEGVVTLDPTCTEEGEMTYTCSACGATKTETIPALGHTVKVYPDGKVYYMYNLEDGKWYAECSVCGEWAVELDLDLYGFSEFVLVANSDASLTAALTVAKANEDASEEDMTRILVYGKIEISEGSYVAIDCDYVEIYGLGADVSSIVLSSYVASRSGDNSAISGIEITGKSVTIRDLTIDGTALNGLESTLSYKHAVEIGSGADDVLLSNLVILGGGNKIGSSGASTDGSVVVMNGTSVKIEDCDISGGYNGVVVEYSRGDPIVVTVSGGKIDAVRAIWLDNGDGVTLVVEDATICGQISFASKTTSATFTDCTLGFHAEDGVAYGLVNAYADATFENCAFLANDTGVESEQKNALLNDSNNYVIQGRTADITINLVGCMFYNTNDDLASGELDVSATNFIYLVGARSEVKNFYIYFDGSETAPKYCYSVDDQAVLHIHLDGDWVGTVTTPAGCTTEGSMSYTCSVCGETFTDVIPATGHAATAYDGTFYAVYDSSSSWWFLCENCGDWIDISSDESFSVYDFDLVARDEASLLAALELGRVNESSTDTDGTRIFVDGQITLSDDNLINIDFDSVEIYGSGAGSSEIVLSSYMSTHSGTAQSGVMITGSNVTIRDLTINGDALNVRSHSGYTYVHAVEVRENADNVLLSGLVVTGGGTAANSDSSIIVYSGTNVRIVDCDLSGASTGLTIEHGSGTPGAEITVTVEFSGGSIEGDYRSIWVDGGSGVKLDVENAEINGRNAIGGGIVITFTGCTFGYHTETLLIFTTVYGSISANGDVTMKDCTFLSYDSGSNVDSLYKSSGSGNYTILQNAEDCSITLANCYFYNTHSDLEEGWTLLTKDNFVYVVGSSCVDVSLYFEEGEDALEYLYTKSDHSVVHNHVWEMASYDFSTGVLTYKCYGCGESYAEITGTHVDSMDFDSEFVVATLDDDFSDLGFTITMSDADENGETATTYTSIEEYLTNYRGDTVTWTSSDTSVATVDGFGNVTLIASGYTTITVEFAVTGVTASYLLCVGEAIADDDPILGTWSGTNSVTVRVSLSRVTLNLAVTVTVTKEGFTLGLTESTYISDLLTIWDDVPWFKVDGGYYILVDGELIEIGYNEVENQISASFDFSFSYSSGLIRQTIDVTVEDAVLSKNA